MSISPAQLDYLDSDRRLARLATADTACRPQVTPVGMWHYNRELGTVDVTGHNFSSTRKYRNVVANPQACLVVDDLASIDPWRPRGVMIEGPAEAVTGVEGTEPLIRITPENVVSWGLEG